MFVCTGASVWFKLQAVQRADRSDDLFSSLAAGVSSRVVGSLDFRWENNVVNSNSPVSAGRSVKSFYVAYRKAFVGFGIAAIKERFLL